MRNCADLQSEFTMLEVAEKLVKANLIQEIRKLPTHEYREYDGHDEVVRRECVYLSDLMNLLER